MNRKSIVQILVLVLLIAVGAGVYLSQQEGGLDFVLDLVGLGPGEVPKAVVTPKPMRKATAPAPKPAHEMAAKAKEVVPSIPAHPASGTVRNGTFTVDSANINNGVLTLRAGGPSPTEVKVYLRTRAWYVPSERSFQVMPATTVTDSTPKVGVRWSDSAQAEPVENDFTEKYTLKLEFDKVQNGKLPGKIYLALPDESKSQVAGTFTADIRGFHLVDGKPDLTIDSVDTLQYLALHEVLKGDPDMKLTDVAFRQGRYRTATAGAPPSGYIEIQYRVADAEPAERKFQFVKEQDQWRVAGTLRPDELDAAHPREVPAPKDPPEQLFPYLAARKIEADAQKRHPGQLLVASEFATRYNEKKKIGVVDVGYKVGDGAPVRTAFLFRLDKKGWKLDRELKKKERVNLATGKIGTKR